MHPEDPRRRLRDEERAAQVDVDHQIEVLLAHVQDGLVAQDAGIVHHDVELAELVQRAPHHPVRALARGDAVVVRDRIAAHAFDLGHHLVGHLGPLTASVPIAAEIVHHHPRALAREEQRVLAADASARSGDDRHFAFEQTHVFLRVGGGF